jgi:large subunit ribosomal protein L25
MAEILIEAQSREEKGKSVRKLRREGFIPGVIYGSGKEGTPVKVSQKDFVNAMKGHSLENLVVTIKLSHQKKKNDLTVLIRDVQVDPLKDVVIHVDFQEVSLEKKLRTKVRVESVGEPIGVTQQGGILDATLREIEIECLPMNIPEALIVDVSKLNVGDSLYVRDIQTPEGVNILTGKDISVFSVTMPKMEEEVPKEAQITEPEVIGKKKEAETPEGEAPAEKKEAEKGAEKKEPEKKEAEKKKEK